jgi:hypothetical protein
MRRTIASEEGAVRDDLADRLELARVDLAGAHQVAYDVVELCGRVHPEVAVVDLGMPGDLLPQWQAP